MFLIRSSGLDCRQSNGPGWRCFSPESRDPLHSDLANLIFLSRDKAITGCAYANDRDEREPSPLILLACEKPICSSLSSALHCARRLSPQEKATRSQARIPRSFFFEIAKLVASFSFLRGLV